MKISKNFHISISICFGESNTVKLVVDNVICEEIVATDGQSLFN